MRETDHSNVTSLLCRFGDGDVLGRITKGYELISYYVKEEEEQMDIHGCQWQSSGLAVLEITWKKLSREDRLNL